MRIKQNLFLLPRSGVIVMIYFTVELTKYLFMLVKKIVYTTVSDNYTSKKGPLWSYGSWIYNYLCSQGLS